MNAGSSVMNQKGISELLSVKRRNKEPKLDEKNAKALHFEGDSFFIGSEIGGYHFPDPAKRHIPGKMSPEFMPRGMGMPDTDRHH